VFGGKSLLKWFDQLKTLPKLWVRTTDQHTLSGELRYLPAGVVTTNKKKGNI